MAWIGPAIGAAGSILGGAMNAQSQGDVEKQMLKVAKYNAEQQAKENEIQRQFALKLLDMSHPQMTGDELGDLLFAQGQGEYNEQSNKAMQMALRQNMRLGMPTSANKITAGFAGENAKGMADRRSASTLQGIMGVLPGATAQQVAGGLYKTPAPVMAQTGQFSQPNAWGDVITGIGQNLGGLWDKYRTPSRYTQIGNQGGTA